MIINNRATLIPIEQNSPEWLEWRKGGIGSSAIPVIMGESPYMTAKQLWEEYVGLRPPKGDNFFFQHGHRWEPLARQVYNEAYAESMVPHCFELNEKPYCRVSLDGINMDYDVLLEVKNHVKIKDHLTAREGQVPAHYYGQVQFQIYVTGCRKGHFWSCFNLADPDPLKWSTALVEVEPDPKYQWEMLDKIEDFWKAVQTRTWIDGTKADVTERQQTEKSPNVVIDMSGNAEWRTAAAEYVTAYKAMIPLKEQLAKAEAAIKRLVAKGGAKGCGLNLKRYPRKGNIDYGSIPAIKEMSPSDLYSYRKRETTVTEISVTE